MNIKYLIYGFIFFLIGQTIAWVQSYGSLIWPKLKENMWISYIIAPLIGFFFIYGTKYVVQAFDGVMWPSRLIGFSAGIIVFSIATSMFAKEGINLKTIVSLLLCLMILLIQIFWKTN